MVFKFFLVKTGRFFTTPKKDISKTDEFLAYKNSLMFVISTNSKVSTHICNCSCPVLSMSTSIYDE